MVFLFFLGGLVSGALGALQSGLSGALSIGKSVGGSLLDVGQRVGGSLFGGAGGVLELLTGSAQGTATALAKKGKAVPPPLLARATDPAAAGAFGALGSPLGPTATGLPPGGGVLAGSGPVISRSFPTPGDFGFGDTLGRLAQGVFGGPTLTGGVPAVAQAGVGGGQMAALGALVPAVTSRLPQIGGAIARAIPGIVGGVAVGEAIDIAAGGAPGFGGGGNGMGGQLFRQGPARVSPIRELHAVNPMTGRIEVWRHMGRPVLFSGDFAAVRRVSRVSARARRRLGRKR